MFNFILKEFKFNPREWQEILKKAMYRWNSMEMIKLLIRHIQSNLIVLDVLKISVDVGNEQIFRHLLNERNGKLEEEYESSLILNSIHKNRVEIFKLFVVERGLNLKHPRLVSIAAQHDSFDVLKYMIECGAEIDEPNSKGETPLFTACTRPNLDIIEFLIESGSDYNRPNINGESPLHICCKFNHLLAAKVLLSQKNIDLDRPNVLGQTALFSSVSSNHLDLVKCLIEKGANANKCDQNGTSPISSAVITKNVEIVKFLVSKNVCDLNLADKHNERPLYNAVHSENWPILNCIVESKKVDLDALNGIHQETALSLAASRNYLEIVKYLISSGADHKIVNKINQKPIEVALDQGSFDVYEYLNELDGGNQQSFMNDLFE